MLLQFAIFCAVGLTFCSLRAQSAPQSDAEVAVKPPDVERRSEAHHQAPCKGTSEVPKVLENATAIQAMQMMMEAEVGDQCGKHQPSMYKDKSLIEHLSETKNWEPRIAGGLTVGSGEFPSYVGIKIMIDPDPDYGQYYKCGGTVVHPRIVLTAAHCLEHEQKPLVDVSTSLLQPEAWPEDAEALVIRSERHCMSKTYVHKKYLRHDYAVIILPRNQTFAGRVQPACLPKEPVNASEVAFTVGNGMISKEMFPLSLQVLPTKQTLCPTDCPEFTCYQPKNNLGDACRGDSGGPTYVVRDKKQHLAAITSHGPNKCSSTQLGRGHNLNVFQERGPILQLMYECYHGINT